MKPLRRSLTPVSLSATLLLSAACAPPPSAPAPSEAPAATPSVADAPDVSGAPDASAGPEVQLADPPAAPVVDEVALRRTFNSLAVHHDRPARRVLYTWTTAAQIEELRRDPTLLTRTTTTDGQTSYYQKLVTTLAGKKDPAAMLLRDPAFDRQRYAWSNPWATVLGFGEERWGDQVVRIELRADAVLAVIVAEGPQPEIRFVGLDGAAVGLSAVKARPGRLAGAYFVSPKVACDTLGAPAGCGTAYREIVLFNEAAISLWSYGGEAVLADLDAAAATLGDVRTLLAAHPPEPRPDDAWIDSVLHTIWPTALPEPQIEHLYEAALAGLEPRYTPTAEHLDHLITAVAELRKAQGAPMTHSPTAAFPGLKTRPHRRVPLPVRNPHRTM